MFPILDEQGAVVTVLCIGADLTPHLEASARREAANEALTALRQSNALLEQENLALRQERDRHAAAAKAAAQTRATELANDSGPIPGLEDHHSSTPTLAQLERRYIIHTLEETRGRVSGAKGAAAILGLHPNTLRSRMEKLGIARVS
jgi:transcriptional regulator with GAF, ATPase, and Fis domain